MVIVTMLAALAGGCLGETSFPLQPDDFVRISPAPAPVPGDGAGETMRQWVVRAHGELASLLPPKGRQVLTTEEMADESGRPVDVYQRMGKPRKHLNLITKNFNALVHSSQAAAPGYAVDSEAEPWPGFQTVWIPVDDDVQLCGRLGFATADDGVTAADCIILLPGIFGDNGVVRSRDLSYALRDSGFHVLSLELRGHGQTEARYPDVYYTFGVFEAPDLLKVSDWLQDRYPQVRRTGLIGFCWGGNVALLAAWYDGCLGRHPAITPRLARCLDPVNKRSRFTAGVLSFSTVLDWEEIVDYVDVPHRTLDQPSLAALQRVIRDRDRMKAHPEVSGNLRRLIAYEFAGSALSSSLPIDEIYRFVRLRPHRNLPFDEKISSIRVPTLLVHAVNDPFTMAQGTADFLVPSDNQNVAGLILRGGGHIGFFPYNRAYAYSLILNFFDPQRGPGAVQSRSHAQVSPIARK